MAAEEQSDVFYRLLIGQLRYDGHTEAAKLIKQRLEGSGTPLQQPSNELFTALGKVLAEQDRKKKKDVSTTGPGPAPLDFENSDATGGVSRQPPFETTFYTTHQGPVCDVAISPDGKLAATAASDGSIKLLSCDRCIQKATGAPDAVPKAVLKTVYDHTGAILGIDFHPSGNILVSAGSDSTVRLFDTTQIQAKRSVKTLNEVAECRKAKFHPCGQYILVGTTDPTIRLYNAETWQCFAGMNRSEDHSGPITDIAFNRIGTQYASCSMDGSVKLWDSTTNKVVMDLKLAHDGEAVASARHSRTGHYLLTSGLDSKIHLWDLRQRKVILDYEGGRRKNQLVPAIFAHGEDIVLSGDESKSLVLAWNARNGEHYEGYKGHTQYVSALAAHPQGHSFVSGSEDFRVRFWYDQSFQGGVQTS
eukprot:Clim_evm39s108 gene=Clim_evmTU39s108